MIIVLIRFDAVKKKWLGIIFVFKRRTNKKLSVCSNLFLTHSLSNWVSNEYYSNYKYFKFQIFQNGFFLKSPEMKLLPTKAFFVYLFLSVVCEAAKLTFVGIRRVVQVRNNGPVSGKKAKKFVLRIRNSETPNKKVVVSRRTRFKKWFWVRDPGRCSSFDVCKLKMTAVVRWLVNPLISAQLL